jgi:ketosteroid isomerase-like protein
MPQDNVEVVRSVLEAGVDRVLVGLLDPSVRLDLSERVFNPAVYEGYEGLRRWRSEVNDVWDSYRVEPVEFFEGEDVVVVLTRERGRGAGSGAQVDRLTTFVFRLADRRVTEIRLYGDRDQAFAAAGLVG